MLDVAHEYVALGLRFDAVCPGFVDAFTGEGALRAAVAAEPASAPARLAARARELLRELDGADLAGERISYLRGQLVALECNARKFDGEEVKFLDEVAAYFQVRPELADTAAYADAHAQIDALLPGSGPLAQRLEDFRHRDECPPDKLEIVVRELSGALRERVRAEVGLPETETVDYRIVTDKPWSGFNYYHGNFRSQVAINADLPHRLAGLPHLIAHESYPGHHTEHCRKERDLVQARRFVEHTVFLVNTPECLMAEGLADLGLAALVGPGWGRWAADILAEVGLHTDGETAERLAEATAPLGRVRQDAAIMLHDRGADADDVVAYLQRWALIPAVRARQALRFLTDPLWRAYTSTYVEGDRLLRRWLADRPAGQSALTRFRRLLDEPLTPARIMAENAAG